MRRDSIPLWFGLSALALLAALAAYVGRVYRQAEDLRVVAEATMEVVAASFEIERGVRDALAGSRASGIQVRYAEERLERSLAAIEGSREPGFVNEARWMRLQQQSSRRLQGIVAGQTGPGKPVVLLDRLSVSLSELSDTAVLLHRMTYRARTRSVQHLFLIELAVIGVAIAAVGALLALHQRHVRQRAEAERALRAANDALTVHAEEKDQLLYAASHDLKEPLRMVTAYTDLLQKELAGADPKALRFFGYVHEGARRMRRLLDDLLAATLAERPSGAAVDVDLGEEAQAIARLFEQPLLSAGGALRIGTLPHVHVDRQRLGQVLQNLVGNAIKYRAPDRAVEITIGAEAAPDGMCLVTIADNGQGIDQRHHTEIFRLFRRLHGPEIEGTGAGLAICKRMVESWGGRLWVESSAGAGSRFRFTVPPARD